MDTRATTNLSSSVCITSILRFTTLNLATAHTDVMWQSIDSSMWTVIEYNLGIITASMPALRRPLAAVFSLLLRRGGSSVDQLRDDYRCNSRASSDISTASTMTSRFSFSHMSRDFETLSSLKEVEAPSQKENPYRSGLRTEFYESSEFDFEKGGDASNGVSSREFQYNDISKTEEGNTKPGSARSSVNRYRLFPK